MPSIKLPSERRREIRAEQTMSLVDAPDLGYRYPFDLPLKPGTEFHDDLLNELLLSAKESASAMELRHPDMEKMERTMCAFISQDDKEKISKQKDARKPTSIVVPFTYAVYDSMSTQVLAAYAANDELHFYRGNGPEDTIGAMLGEKLIALQSAHFNELASIATSIRDEMTYGFAAMTPVWVRENAYRNSTKPLTFTDPITGEVIPDPTGATEDGAEEYVSFEGNRVFNIDPYSYLPDPNVAMHLVQDGECVGWKAGDSKNGLLNKEYSDPSIFFNCKYLRYIGDDQGLSTIFSGRERRTNRGSETRLAPVDVIYRYHRLVPSEWGLGDGERPEIWMFAVAADKIIICARPLGLYHNMFPVVVMASDTDGYSSTPTSRLETTYGLQNAVDFKWNSHMAFAKKGLLGEFLVREENIGHMGDIVNSAIGRIIRISRLAMNVPLENVVKQLQVSDPTAGNVNDIMALHDWMQRATGATDTLMGIMRSSGERRSATESRGARMSALSRIDRIVRIRNSHGFNNLGRMLFSQTAQLLSQEMYVQCIGRYEEDLRAELGVLANDPWIVVDPRRLNVSVDVIAGDSNSGGEEFFQDWIQLYGMIIGNPQLAMQLDMLRIFKHIARLGGAKNISDFAIKNPMNMQVMGDQQLQQQMQAGNLVPVGEGVNAPNRIQ